MTTKNSDEERPTLVDFENRRTEWPLPDGWTETTLGEFRVDTSKSINPGKQPEQEFELYSVPSYENRLPELASGADIGSSKRIVQENTVLLCKINPRINRVWIVGNHSDFSKIASTEWIPFDDVEGVAPKYLRYFMLQNSFRDFLAQNASGVGGSLMRVKPASSRRLAKGGWFPRVKTTNLLINC